ncbi:hypothetical protein A5893_12930 [Pedobacter psychrophilus]|uniref:Uncharacterized protein n=1 Tax=Pedobacter psychrophilus TaxID=1826909 RepID=A0A179DD07_9SPHI|nr:hypothetical protein [Pedobacter psychrophilus]OAQ38936.1 hypothetical protein A5893_12930 [Pedobacter psychrophilus]
MNQIFKKLFVVAILILISIISAYSQNQTYWNNKTQLIPWRMPLNIQKSNFKMVDLDKDGDPDLLYYTISNDVPVVWIDDDDDMKWTDLEGDADSDCLLIDRNKDGIFAGPLDFSIDWCDEDGDGKADLQVIVNNGAIDKRNAFDFDSEIMYVLDTDKDQIMNYIDWNTISMLAWEHNGHANFFEDYHGNTSFIKTHASSFRINNLKYGWENPFHFYDYDGDNLSEMAIRFVNTPTFRPADNSNPIFKNIDKERDLHFNGMMDYVGITWDLDNDNSPANEFDFDMSLLLKGNGFDYSKQVNKFKSLKGLGKQADFLFYDKRWRELDTLIFPNKDNAWDLTFKKGDWNYASLVFDEDDDCNRWERVEYYEPKDLFKMGANKGGLDNNPQADVIGDRGEFDTDFSGKGKLYIGSFDGKVHLYGAEWGAWRVDQIANSFQGYGGLYDRWKGKGRMQIQPDKFALIKYEDTDNNGFIDKILYDLDGDKIFEDSVSFSKIGIDDKQTTIESESFTYQNGKEIFKTITDKNWSRAQEIIAIAEKAGVNTHWYNFYKTPLSLHQKYDYAFWLNFYIYKDLRQHYLQKNNTELVNKLDKAYYSGKWEIMNN